jgi:hypothetical protein
MNSKLNRLPVWLALTTALCTPSLAMAQSGEEPEPNVTVQERPRPEYDPIGIRAGSFFIYPSLTVEGAYDSNVFATEDDEEDDFFATVTPQIDAQSNFSRHALNFTVGAEGAAYNDYDENNYLDFFSSADGRLDITRDDALSAALGLSRLHEDRESADSVGRDEDVTQYWQEVARLNYRHDFNRFFTLVGGDITRFDYLDNGDINEDDRDRNQYRGRARLGYNISERFAGFVEGAYDVRRYDNTPNDQGVDRDSEGYAIRGGTEIDITGILFGELALGYTHRNYDDESLDSFGGLGGGGKLTWNVTPLTTVIFEATGEIQETTVEVDGDPASADFEKAVTVDVTHELLRNVLLNANAGYIRDDFEGTDRTDNTYLAGAGVTYLLNRNLSLDATYRFSTRDSDADGGDYTRSIVRLGITARL